MYCVVTYDTFNMIIYVSGPMTSAEDAGRFADMQKDKCPQFNHEVVNLP